MIRSDLRFQVVTKKRVEISFTPFRDYPEIAKKVIKEMHRQVGDLVFNESGTFHLNCTFDNICDWHFQLFFFSGLAKQGLLVRHLVMPGKP
jgi:uncharacterized Fe-S radical SAM superfamily protein PflX